MSQEQDGQDRMDAPDAREDYAAPALAEIGSFEDLTEAGLAGGPDAIEGLS